MSTILLISLAIRFMALAICLHLVVRIRDWRISLLIATTALMALRQVLTLLRVHHDWPISLAAQMEEMPGLLVSVLMLVSIFLLDQMILHDRFAIHAQSRESSQLRKLLDGSLLGITIQTELRPQYANDAFARMLGFGSAADVVNRSAIAQAFAPDDANRLQDSVVALMRGDSGPQRFEIRGNHCAGHPVCLEAYAQQVSWNENPAVQFTYVDITERKRAEEKAHATGTLLRAVFDHLPAVLFAKDADGRFVMVNPAFAETVGAGTPEVIGRTWPEVAAPLGIESPAAVGSDDQVLKEGRIVTIEQNELRFQDRPTRIQRLIKAPLRDESGQLGGLLGIGMDVTQLVQAERELREREWMLDRILEIGGIGVWKRDVSTGALYWGAGTERIWGFGPETVEPSFDMIVERVHPEEREKFLSGREAVMRTGGGLDETVRIIRPDGSIHHVRTVGELIRDEAGQPMSLIGLTQDLTEQVQTERALRESEERFRAIVENLPYSYTIVDQVDGRLVFANEAFRTEFSITDALENHFAAEFYANPADRTEVLEDYRRSGRYGPRELQFRTADGRDLWVLASGKSISFGGRPAFVTTWVDVSERRHAEMQMRESESKYRDLVETSQHLIFRTDADGRFVYLNPAWEDTLGYAVDEMLNRPFTDFKDPIEAERSLSAFSQMLGGRFVQGYPTVYRSKSGDDRTLIIRGKPYQDSAGRVVGVQGTAVDATEQVRTEYELRTSRRLLELIIDAIPMWIFAKDADSNYILVNKAMAEFFGLSKGEFLNRHTSRLPSPAATQEKSLADDRWVYERRETLDQPEVLLERPDGTPVPFQSTKIPLFGDSGELIGLLGINRDITEQKRVEEEREAHRQLLQALLETIPAPIILKNAEGHYEMVNSAMAQFYGSTVEAIVGLHTSELPGIDAQEKATLMAEDQHVVATGSAFMSPEAARTASDGSQRNFQITKAPLFDRHGRLTHIVGYASDITEIKYAERALRESGQILEQISDAVVVVDLEDRIIRWSKGAERLYGYRADEILGKPISVLWPKDVDGAAKQKTLYDEILPNEGASAIVEREKKSGERFFISISLSRLKDERGEVYGLVGTSHDVTGVVEAQRSLRSSEERLRSIVSSSLNGIVVHRAFKPLFVNQAYAEIFGYDSADEMMGMESLLPIFVPEELEEIREKRGELRNSGQDLPARFEITGVRKDGTRIHLLNYWRFVEWEGERAVLGTVIDITDRKRMEDELRATTELLQTVFDTMPQFVFVKDREGQFTMVGGRLVTQWNLDAEQLLGRRLMMEERATPQDFDVVGETDQRVISDGQTVEYERERSASDGRKLYLNTIKTPLRNPAGEIVGIVGVTQDMTERHTTEVERERYQNLMDTILDNVPIILWSTDRQGVVTLAAGKGLEAQSLSSGDVIGRSVFEVYADYPDFLQMVQEGLSGQELVRVTETRGAVFQRWIHPVYDPQGQLDGIIGVSLDVTERERMEADLRASKELLQAVFDAFPNHLHVKGLDLRYRMVNRGFANDSGRAPEEMVGRSIEDLAFLTPEQRATLTEQERRVIETGEAVALPSFPYTKPNGEEVFETTVKYPYRGSSGRVEGIVTYTVDVTETMRAQQELRDSEKRYRDLVEGSIQGVLIHRDFRTLSVSQPLAEMLGYASAEELEQVEDSWQLVAPASRDALREVHSRRQRGEMVPALMEMQMLTKSGTPVWVERRQRIVQWEGEDAVQVVIHNIHDRKLAEQDLRAKEQAAQQAYETLQLAIASSPAGLALYDDSDRLITCNERFRSYFTDGGVGIHPGLTFEAIVRAFSMSGSLKSPQRVGDSWIAERIRQHRHPAEAVLLQLADGRWLQVTERKGENEFISTAYLDITELVQTQDDLRALNAQLEQRVQERTDELRSAQAELVSKERLATLGLLTGVVSHELRNPLGTIRTSVFTVREVAREHGLDLDKPVARIDRNIDRCDRIIEELLAYTRPPRGDTEPVPMDDLLAEVLHDSISHPEGIRIGEELQGRAVLQVDRERIRRAIINIVQNAVQAITDQASRTEGNIWVSSRCTGDRYEILVRDDGPGISDENLERLFEPLFSTKGFGVGLGLPIVKQIMEAHQGGIEMKSDGQTGSTVLLWLPLEVNNRLN